MFKKLLILTSFAAVLNAATTMCYKKNHFDPETIESIPLKGGKCEGVLSANQMKEHGYTVKDIKISDGDSGLNYMYIFEKADAFDTAIINGQTMSKEDLKSYINELKVEDEIKQKKAKAKANLAAGKESYIKHCQECHGEKGEIKAYGTRALIKMSSDDIEITMRDYALDEVDSSYAFLMKPYAVIVNENQVKNIIGYLETLK